MNDVSISQDHPASNNRHWYVELLGEQAGLQRVLLVFSRQRLRITGFEYALRPGCATLHVQASCSAQQARAVSAQLGRIVEVLTVAEEPEPERMSECGSARNCEEQAVHTIGRFAR